MPRTAAKTMTIARAMALETARSMPMVKAIAVASSETTAAAVTVVVVVVLPGGDYRRHQCW